jgi:transcriptional regulator with XRE-family HTH domain
MMSETFREALKSAGLSQRDLSRFLGLNAVTVNRWCSSRSDSVEPPRYARAFVKAYAKLRPIDRKSIAEDLDG